MCSFSRWSSRILVGDGDWELKAFVLDEVLTRKITTEVRTMLMLDPVTV